MKHQIMLKIFCFIIMCLSNYFFTKAQNHYPDSGNVGIGTTTPLTNLQVYGAGSQVIFGDPTSSMPALKFFGGHNSGYAYIQSGGLASPKLRISKYQTEDENLDEFQIYSTKTFLNGSVGIGTSSFGTYRLQLKQTSSNSGYGLRVLNANEDKSAQLWVGTKGAVLDAEGTSNLHFRTNNIDRILILNDGKTAFGTTNPASRIHIKHSSHLYNPGGLIFENSSSSSVYNYINSGNNFFIGYNTNAAENYPQDDYETRFFIKSNGNIGIGTTTPIAKLSVNGNIRAREVKILTNITAPDYVFDSNYKLPSLKETKAYIIENKHLPEIPSACEIKSNGIDIGDMNLRLLKKIEELTLHQINLMETLEQQSVEIQNLKKQLSEINN